jgi:hypothetical protein
MGNNLCLLAVGLLAYVGMAPAAEKALPTVERLPLTAGAPDPQSRVGVPAAYDFEASGSLSGWTGYEKTPVAVSAPDGALGSSGFLRVGPHPDRWVGAGNSRPFVARDDTWIGFSARLPKGGVIKLMLADGRQKKNVSQQFKLPEDGTWATHSLQVRWLGVTPGTPITRLSFFIDNPSRAPLYVDLDNVVIGSGAGDQPPDAVPGLTAAYNGDLASLTWSAPQSPAGVREFRLYRGLHAEFARDPRHLLEVTTKAAATDAAFAHNGAYFYAVRAVDFGGGEGPDAGAVRVEVK